MPAKVLDKIYGVVYNTGNHEIDCVHSDTQKKPPKVAAFGGFFWDHVWVTLHIVCALWKFHKYFDFCHTIVTKRT